MANLAVFGDLAGEKNKPNPSMEFTLSEVEWAQDEFGLDSGPIRESAAVVMTTAPMAQAK